MAGDEIVAEWLGDVFSTNMQIQSTPTRFWNVSKRFKTFRIWNPQPACSVYVGKYHSVSGTFNANAFVIGPDGIMEFTYIDIHEIAYNYYNCHQFIRVIGINEY
jgi:hypothetical protein